MIDEKDSSVAVLVVMLHVALFVWNVLRSVDLREIDVNGVTGACLAQDTTLVPRCHLIYSALASCAATAANSETSTSDMSVSSVDGSNTQ